MAGNGRNGRSRLSLIARRRPTEDGDPRRELRRSRRDRFLWSTIWPAKGYLPTPELLSLGTTPIYRRDHDSGRLGPHRRGTPILRLGGTRCPARQSLCDSSRKPPRPSRPWLESEPPATLAEIKEVGLNLQEVSLRATPLVCAATIPPPWGSIGRVEIWPLGGPTDGVVAFSQNKN